MGVVQREAVKSSVFGYIGIGIGVLSSYYVYPYDLETKGLVDSIIRWGTLIFPLLTLGFGAVMVRFAPYAKEDKRVVQQRLFSLGLKIAKFRQKKVTLVIIFYSKMNII